MLYLLYLLEKNRVVFDLSQRISVILEIERLSESQFCMLRLSTVKIAYLMYTGLN